MLGLAPDADEQQIKAAYRTLARRFHPDLNVGDAASAERLAEINRAYETLSAAEARAAYDRELAEQRGAAQRRQLVLAVTAAGTCIATAGLVSLAILWLLRPAPAGAPTATAKEAFAHSPMPSRLPDGMATGAGTGTGSQAASIGSPEQMPGGTAANWTTYRDVRFDFTLRYPAGIFSFDPGRSDANVHTFMSRDGRASLRIVAAENTAGIKLGSFRRTLIKERYAGASFDRTPQRRHWFALSGTRGDEVFLERITFSCDGKSMHGWQMRYPSTERATYDEVAQLVLRNHPHGNGPGTSCNDAKKAKEKAKRRKRRD